MKITFNFSPWWNVVITSYFMFVGVCRNGDMYSPAKYSFFAGCLRYTHSFPHLKVVLSCYIPLSFPLYPMIAGSIRLYIYIYILYMFISKTISIYFSIYLYIYIYTSLYIPLYPAILHGSPASEFTIDCTETLETEVVQGMSVQRWHPAPSDYLRLAALLLRDPAFSMAFHGGFHGHGVRPHSWMVLVRENPILK